MKTSYFIILGLLATLSTAYGECEKAKDYYERAVSPGVEWGDRVRLLNLSLEDCESFAAYYELGKACFMNGKPHDAINALNRAAVKFARTDREKAMTYHAMARVHLSGGDEEKATICYRKSLGFSGNKMVESELMKLEKGRMGSVVSSDKIVSTWQKCKSIDVVPSIDVPVHFNFNSWDLTEKGRRQAEEIAKAMMRMGSFRFRLIGHTDSRGDDDYNDRLSLKRAQSVRDYILRTSRIDAAAISAEGKGERRLLYHDNTEDAHALNRRVEVVIESAMN